MTEFQDTREPSQRFNPCLLSSLRFLSACSGFLVLMTSAAVLAGWITRTETLLHPDYQSLVMRPNTALAFILCTLSLWFGSPGGHGVRQSVAFACSATVFLVGAITVIENLFGIFLPMDYLLLPVHVRESWAADPWRLGLLSGISLLFLSLALFATMWKEEEGARASQMLAAFAFLAALIGLMDQILNPKVSQLHIPTLTVLCLALISTAIFIARPAEGAMRIIAADGLGGSMARRLVPAAILVSVLISWARWHGQSLGYYEAELGAAVGVAIQVVLFGWLILANANYLEKADQLRRRAEEVARQQHEKLQQQNAGRIVELLKHARELEQRLEDEKTP